MTMTRAILEMGMGNDLHGEDYTKAAKRAINDALHHSSLSFIKTLNIDKNRLFVNVTIGVQKPESVETEQLKKLLPRHALKTVVAYRRYHLILGTPPSRYGCS